MWVRKETQGRTGLLLRQEVFCVLLRKVKNNFVSELKGMEKKEHSGIMYIQIDKQ